MVFYVALALSLLVSGAAWAQGAVSRQPASFAGTFAGGPTDYTMVRPEPLGWLNNKGFTVCGAFGTVNSGAATVSVEGKTPLPVRVQSVHGELALGGGELTGTQCLTVNSTQDAVLLPGIAGGIIADPVLVSPHTVTRAEWVFGQQFIANNADITLDLPDPTTLSDQSGITIQTVDGNMTLVPPAGAGINGYTPGASIVIPKNVTTMITTSAQPGLRAFRVPIGVGGGGPGGGRCDDDVHFFNRIPPAMVLDPTYRAAYESLICNLKADGVFQLLDALYVFATRDKDLAEINLVSANDGDRWDLTEHAAGGRPIFTAREGVTMGPDGNTDVYFDTHLNPATATGLKYTTNSAHIMAWSFGTHQSTGFSYAMGAADASNNTGLVPWNALAGTGQFTCSINQANAGQPAAYDVLESYEAFVCSRTGAAALQMSRRGIQLIPQTAASNAVAMPSNPFWLGNISPAGVGGPWILRAASIGAGLTAGQIATPPGVQTSSSGLLPRLCQFFITIGGAC